ncbi:MAG: DUF4838 domain-containing protein [Clostridia bacterium]|nr:DUF4838 domain-containing protein [Clostridia bacterium]
MKKILSLLILAVMIASMIPFSAPANAAYGYLPGDANDDSAITISDVHAVRKYIAGIFSEKDISFVAADVTKDKNVTISDVLLLRKHLVGISDLEGNNENGKYKVNEIKLGGKNITRFTIVYPRALEDESVCLTSAAYAATELQKYVKDACGYKLNIAYTDEVTEGYKIEYNFDDTDEFGLEGFALEATDSDFVIHCGSRRAAVYATYTFLEDIVGWRFLTDSVLYLYPSELINVPDGYYDEEIPTAEYRAIGANDPGVYYAPLKINASEGGASAASKGDAYKIGGAVGTTYLHAHSFVYYMAGFENRNDPSLNSVAGGEQPCMTSEETYNKIIDFMYKCIDWRTEGGQVPGFHYTQVSCSANDNGNYCTCTECKNAYMLDGSVAGALIRLCNRVAEKFCADYPMLDIYTAAYAGAHVPPKMTRPDPRVNICFCSVGCNNHSLRNQDECAAAGGNPRLKTQKGYDGPNVNQSNVEWMDYIKGWLELTDNVWYWYYTDNWAYYVSSAPNLYNFWDDIKYLTELGVKGFYLEGDADRINYSFEALRKYLMTKIMWNPEMSEEEYVNLMDEFLQIYYGEGWQNLKQYLEEVEIASDGIGCWTNNYDYPWDEYDEVYFRDNYDRFYDLFMAAYNAAETAAQKNRIEQCSLHMNFLGLSATFNCDYVSGDSASRAKYKERYTWLWNYYKNHPETLTMNTGFLAHWIDDNHLDIGGMWCFPSSPDTPCDPMNWLLDDESGFTGARHTRLT